MNAKIAAYAKTLGPGVLFASTAIGVSHLVQSTRAGAEFGYALVAFVILANVLKYPFFEFSSRYSGATGTSIIDGYLKLGRRPLWLYLIITVASMFFVTAAVGFVTAGFFENLFGLGPSGDWTVLALFGVCAAILIIGRYSVLDGLIKVICSVMVVSTVLAFVIILWNGPVEQVPDFVPPEILTQAGILFIIALMGWMPLPVDISSWHSIWTVERMRQTKFRPTLKAILGDFNAAYAVTAVLAVIFLILGAHIFYGSGQGLPDGNARFAAEIVSIYTQSIGQWSGLIISASAFSVMFGTIIAIFDGYTRALHRTVRLLNRHGDEGHHISRARYAIFIMVLMAGSLTVLTQFGERLRDLVDFAIVVSFLIAPVIAIFNYRLVTGKYVDNDAHPPRWLVALGRAGIAFLVGFAALFILSRLGLLGV